MGGSDRIKELKERERTMQRYFDMAEKAAVSLDPDLLDNILKESRKTCGTAPDIEYSRLGGDRYGFFYSLFDSYYSMVCSAAGDRNIIKDLSRRFRKSSSVLLRYGILPDMKMMTSWNAICTGKLSNPFLLKAYNANQSEAHLPNRANITDIFNMQYPQYMPYLEYSPEQRLMFDEFIHFTALLEKDHRSENRFGEILSLYNFERIKSDAKAICGAVDESEIEEKADIDEMNINLARMFDFYMKSAHAAMTEEDGILHHFNGDREKMKEFMAHNKTGSVTAVPLDVPETRAENEAAYAQKIFSRDLMCPSLATVISPRAAKAAVRIGAALFSPSVLAKANIDENATGILARGFSFDKMVGMTEEYYRFKKSLFVPGERPLRLKELSELAEMPLPEYLGTLRGYPEVCIKDPHGRKIEYKHYDLERGLGSPPSPWSDKQNSFAWLQLFAGFAYPEQGKPIGNWSAEEIKKAFGIPDISDNYREAAIASVKEEFELPEDYDFER